MLVFVFVSLLPWPFSPTSNHYVCSTSQSSMSPRTLLLACGATTGTCSEQTLAADSSETHEARCCSDTNLGSGWSQLSNRGAICTNVWGRSEDSNEVCQDALNYGEALAMCANLGGRLCTAEELLADCTRGSGCSHDNDLIWSSTDVTPSSIPSMNPSISGVPSSQVSNNKYVLHVYL